MATAKGVSVAMSTLQQLVALFEEVLIEGPYGFQQLGGAAVLLR
jgi:hypothetical protein